MRASRFVHGRPIGWAATVLLLTCSSSAWALINPNYTPVDLVNQSKTILRVEVAVGEGGSLEVGDRKALKGQAPDQLVLEIDRTSPTVAKHLAAAVGGENKPALLFLGDFSAAGNDTASGGAGDTPVGLLHIDVTWFALKLDGKKLVLADDKLDIKAVWAGSNAMLEKIVDYVQNDYRADVPVKVGIKWASDLKVAEIAGKVHACLAVELFEPGEPCLLILADTGDRLYRAGTDGKLNDVTDQTGLRTKSRCAASGDFNGDGRLDLACSDGKGITGASHARLRQAGDKPCRCRITGRVHRPDGDPKQRQDGTAGQHKHSAVARDAGGRKHVECDAVGKANRWRWQSQAVPGGRFRWRRNLRHRSPA